MYGLLMVDIAGTTLTAEDIELLQQPQVGGLILFARNVETPQQVRALCEHIKQVNSDIIIAIDQEGGRVARLREGFSPLPAMGKLGEKFTEDPCTALKLAYQCGYLMANEVLAVGIDISFAPVLDVNGISKVIGDRGFHQTTEAVVALSTQFMRGMKAVGMATTGKHFPGHGSVAPDSHFSQAVDERDFADIYQNDMQTFIQTMPWLDALMPAHVIFNQVDDKPAGFSSKWLQEIIRGKLGFDGVLFSDDLSMKAVHSVGGMAERVSSAINAGCDMALVCNDRTSAVEALEIAKTLAPPNQQRLAKMASHIPQWQGNLEKTCQQFSEWEICRKAILEFVNE
ncbi:MAG: beta-N-acetylhexosaminidase [Moraxellaceae bacterium]|nr:beta-N-acetylhexosaminidase [Moraxellaceae bacterium]